MCIYIYIYIYIHTSTVYMRLWIMKEGRHLRGYRYAVLRLYARTCACVYMYFIPKRGVENAEISHQDPTSVNIHVCTRGCAGCVSYPKSDSRALSVALMHMWRKFWKNRNIQSVIFSLTVYLLISACVKVSTYLCMRARMSMLCLLDV